MINCRVTKEYFHAVLFSVLYKVILRFEQVDKILNFTHSNESYWTVLSFSTVYFATQGGSNFWLCEDLHKLFLQIWT